MSNRSRSRLFWDGTPGKHAAKIIEMRREEQLQGKMASARVQARYTELKANRG